MKPTLISIGISAILLIIGWPIARMAFEKFEALCCSSESGATPIIACKLNSAEQVQRSRQIKKELFSKSSKVTELADGFEWEFRASEETAEQLVKFVNFERDCCAFFTFTLIFSPNKENTKLQITGEKEILRSDFFQL